MRIHQDLLNILIEEEIARIVAEAAMGRGFLRAGEHAYRLSRQYPNCGMSGGELFTKIIAAATKAGVMVETNQPTSAAA